MFEFTPVELVGYAASVLIVVSLAMSSVLRLRVINLAGSLTFIVYGLLIAATPIVVTNVVIAVLNGFFLVRALSGRASFSALEVRTSNAYFAEFLHIHGADIGRFQPEFDGVQEGDLCVLLLRDDIPAGAFVGRPDSGILRVVLDYVVPAYRDFKVGRWLYGPGADFLEGRGVRMLTAEATTNAHRRYLRRMGFRAVEGRFVRQLAA